MTVILNIAVGNSEWKMVFCSQYFVHLVIKDEICGWAKIPFCGLHNFNPCIVELKGTKMEHRSCARILTK